MDEKITIADRGRVVFTDRIEAGEMLGRELKKEPYKNVVILGIPKGGLLIAREISRLIKADMDVVLTRKLTAPLDSGRVFGALDEKGKVILDKDTCASLYIDSMYIQVETDRQKIYLTHQKDQYRKIQDKVKLEKRTVILTDDGAVTGSTMRSAIWAIKAEKPARIIVALPVAPESALKDIAKDADRIICLLVPDQFSTVSQYYQYFGELEDDECKEILKDFIHHRLR
jgi:putative phosphoribosyl transferase